MGQPAHPTAAGSKLTMPHAHLKGLLTGVDGLHTGTEVWFMGLVDPKQTVDPGMNHLVAERGKRRALLDRGSRSGLERTISQSSRPSRRRPRR